MYDKIILTSDEVNIDLYPHYYEMVDRYLNTMYFSFLKMGFKNIIKMPVSSTLISTELMASKYNNPLVINISYKDIANSSNNGYILTTNYDVTDLTKLESVFVREIRNKIVATYEKFGMVGQGIKYTSSSLFLNSIHIDNKIEINIGNFKCIEDMSFYITNDNLNRLINDIVFAILSTINGNIKYGNIPDFSKENIFTRLYRKDEDFNTEDWYENGDIVGNDISPLNIEALYIRLWDNYEYYLGVKTKSKNKGWDQEYIYNDISGTLDENDVITSFELLLDNRIIEKYEVLYRFKVKDENWTKFYKNGEVFGNEDNKELLQFQVIFIGK